MENSRKDVPTFCEAFSSENHPSEKTHLEQETLHPNGYPAIDPIDLLLEAETFPWQTVAPVAEASKNVNHWCPDSFAGSCSCQGFLQHVELPGEDSPNERPSQSSHVAFPETFSEAVNPSASGTSTGERPGESKRCPRLPREAVKVLNSWLSQHQLYPYPTEQEKKKMEQQTGLDKKQLRTWFTNARRRKMTGTVSTVAIHPGHHSILSPMERWQHSPPETEPAATFDIMRALENMPSLPGTGSAQFYVPDAWSSNGSSISSFLFGEPSIGSYEHSHSSGSELRFQPLDHLIRRIISRRYLATDVCNQYMPKISIAV